ncbi:MAG: phytanoyl-CoA dioxygenase family protein [Acidimicrobiales bacterium]
MAAPPSVLTTDELDRFRRDGFLVPGYRLPGDTVQQLLEATTALVQERPELVDQPIIGPHLPGGGIHGLHTGPAFLDVATDPGLLDIMEQIMGPDLILWNTVMFYKRQQGGPVTPWHRDAFAYPIEPLATTSVWIAVTESALDNGCMRYIPRSHAAREAGEHDREPRPGQMFSGNLKPGGFDESSAVDVPLEPGQMVLFDVFTIHGARANEAVAPRAGLACRYMPGTSVYRHGNAEVRDQPGYGHESRALMLVRGQDRTGRNDFERGHARVSG